jgi:hypothetical protein
MRDKLAATMVAHGALVFLIGMAAGFPFAFQILGKIELWPIPGSIVTSMPGDYRAWRMAHLEGILNGVMLIAVGAVAPRLPFSDRGAWWVAWGLIATAWGNQIASLIGPIFGGRGLAFGDGVSNSLMYLLFVVAVVAVIAAMWLVFQAARRAAGASR